MAVSLPQTNISTEGSWVLGHTQKQGGSHLQAGVRALHSSSKLTQALSTLRGRMAARTMMAMGVDQKLLNYASFRPYAMAEIIKRHLPADVAFPTVVDPAGGYSPQSLWLAESMPNVECIEIDTVTNVQGKRSCLNGFKLPKNFKMVPADLEIIPLHYVLQRHTINVIVALAAYVESRHFVQLLKYLRQIMPEDGVIVAPFPYAPGIENLARNSLLFRKLAGVPLGMVQSELHIGGMFTQAGFSSIQFYKLSELAGELGKPVPSDVEIIAVATR